MKVSIVTVCYNRVNTLSETIESVLRQDYVDIEFIVIDGASNDGTLDVIKGYNEKINIVVSEPDSGMYEAINKGIRLASGEIIGLIHSDDFLYDSHVISEIVKKFEETNADFIYGDGVFVDPDNTNMIIRNWISGNYHRWKVKIGWLPLHPTCYIRRDVIMRLGLYDENFKIAADTDLLVRYLYDNKLKVGYLRRRIVRMRMGGLSTDKNRRKQMWDEDIRLYKAHGFWALPTKILKMMWKVPQLICK